MGQGGAGDPDHADDVDVEDAVPFVVVVVGHGALGADARVVDHDVESAELGRGGGHGLADGGVVGDVGAVGEQRLLDRGGVQVEYGHLGAACDEEFRGGPADAGGAAGHQGLETLEVAHAACPFLCVSLARSSAQKAPPGNVYRAMDSGRMAAEKPGATGAV